MTHLMSKILLLSTTTLGLAACGFTPLYADKDQALQVYLSQIEVLPISEPEEAAYLLERELKNVLSSSVAHRYDLQIVLKEGRRSAAVTSTAQTARFEYTLQAEYLLTDTDTGKRYTNKKSTVTNYGVVKNSQYSSQVAQEDSVRKAAVKLADRIELDLVLYFKGQVEGTELAPGEELAETPEKETLRDRQIDQILGEDVDRP